MTLIVNEVHLLDGLSKSVLVCAADRRITWPDGRYHSSQHKLFEIPYLRSFVSYHGLAQVYPQGKPVNMSEWLPRFIGKSHRVRDLGTFARNLRDDLHQVVPESRLKSTVSGFHLLGYSTEGSPDFWYLSNAGKPRNPNDIYGNPLARYKEPSRDFLERDAKEHFGWDGTNSRSAKNGACVYRNGDILAHAVAWDQLHGILSSMVELPGFKRPRTRAEFEKLVRVKFEIIAYIYKHFAKSQIIGRPVDVKIISNCLPDS